MKSYRCPHCHGFGVSFVSGLRSSRWFPTKCVLCGKYSYIRLPFFLDGILFLSLGWVWAIAMLLTFWDLLGFVGGVLFMLLLIFAVYLLFGKMEPVAKKIGATNGKAAQSL